MSRATDADWSQLSLTALCDHIEQTHHRYLNAELPRIGLLLDKLTETHGHRQPELYHLQEVYAGMADDLLGHLPKEESIVFSAIRQIEAGKGRPGSFPFASIVYPVKSMTVEHEATSRDLDEVEAFAFSHAALPDVGDDYKAVISALSALVVDTRLHIHKENDVLFPRAIDLEIRGR
ncbi:MAG: hemerythrin domain-containing protein [Mycobacterium leprae]